MAPELTMREMLYFFGIMYNKSFSYIKHRTEFLTRLKIHDSSSSLSGPFMLDIFGPAGPFMHPDHIFLYRSQTTP